MSRVENFLKMYRSKNTISTYRWALTEYFKTVYGENEGKLEDHAERYFQEKRNVQEDIHNFFAAINSKRPKSVRLMIAAVRTFLIENGVELSQKFWRRLRKRVKDSRALTLDKVPSNVGLRRILVHMPIQGKSLFLSLASSGMRIGEALKLQREDIELDKEPCKVNIRGEYTKTGNSRIAFISKETVLTLQEWLKVRNSYLLAASKKSHLYNKNVEDPRVFPFAITTAYSMWKKALKKAGFLKRDSSTNRCTIHPHVLRKFFRTKMGALIPVDVAEALMGHEQYLTEVYRRYSMEDLAKFYKQGESALLVFTEAEEIGKLRVEVEERNKQLQTLVNGLTSENLELKSRVSKTELENTELKKRMQQTEKKLGELEKLIRAR
jgi:integrase